MLLGVQAKLVARKTLELKASSEKEKRYVGCFMSFTFLYFKYTSTYLCKNTIFASFWCCRVRIRIPFTKPTYLKNLRNPHPTLSEICASGSATLGLP